MSYVSRKLTRSTRPSGPGEVLQSATQAARALALAAGPATGRRARVLAALGRGHAKPRLVLPGAAQARGKPVLRRPFHGHACLPIAQGARLDSPRRPGPRSRESVSAEHGRHGGANSARIADRVAPQPESTPDNPGKPAGNVSP